MKNQRIFPGIIFIGIGAYFFLQQTGVTISPQFFSWPTLLMIAGVAFLGQGYIGKDYDAIVPGVLLVGFGLHSEILNHFAVWANQVGIFILILSLGFFLRYHKTNNGLPLALLFLIFSIFLLFYDKITAYFGFLQNGVAFIWKFWPIILIVLGALFLFKNRK